MIRVLTTAMRILDISNREIEKRLQMSPSYLSRLFNGLIELRMEHLLAISRAIGLTPAEFFSLAYPKRSAPPSEAALRLRRVLQELSPPPAPPPPSSPAPALRADEIERKIEETVQRLLGEIGRPSPG
ncbi:MAG TPA: helix-turn-helix transcriptional regulator [Thermoanaerobaculia bacterium]|nr:helix-turn-helix transcriptional regulator [Thermoanaerobaculia bacterium]